jgi:hypothetical protein
MPYMDNTADAAFIPVIISNEALGAFGSYMNLAKTVSLNWDWTSATQGAVLQIPKRGALVANSKASNSAVTVQNPTATTTPVTLNQHWEVSFGIDDVTAVLQNQDTLAGYGQDAAIALAEKVEGYLAAQYAGLTATPITFNATSAATIDASVRAIRKYFTDQKVPKLEQRNVYVSSGIYDQLLTVPQYVQAQNIGLMNDSSDVPLVKGSVLPIYGLMFWESQLVTQTGTTPTIVDHAIAYTQNAFVLAARPLPKVPDGFGAVSEVVQDEDVQMGFRTVSSFNPSMTAVQITLDVLFGAAGLDTRRGIEVDYTHA